ncbi:MAG: serine/threonine-protein kinase [Anaerolineae bacterium]|nr:serine/threonine-protein kinase [Anaerolineae bacterium]
MPLPDGIVLEDRYRIDKLMAEGGMGAIYQGFDSKLVIPVAIKENFFQTPQAVRQFEQEALILARLQHPNLPRVTDHFSFEGKQYLVMDFIEGQDLWEMFEGQGLPLEERQALAYIIQVCDAVSYLHRQKPPIIHRDIKPQNIKVTPDGRAVLVDFGIAKVVETDSRTRTGAQAITPGFSPPEQYSGMGTTPRSDIYSLGATLYAVITGKQPPDSISLMAGGAKFEPPNVLNTQVSRQVSELIEYAMQVKPEHRPPSVDAWQKDLQAVLAGQPTSLEREEDQTILIGSTTQPHQASATTSPPPTPTTKVEKSSVPVLWIGVGVVILLALVGAAFWLGRSGSSNEIDTQSILIALAATATAQAETGAEEPGIDLEATLVALAATATAQQSQAQSQNLITPTNTPAPTSTATATSTLEPTLTPSPAPSLTNTPPPTTTPLPLSTPTPSLTQIAFASDRAGSFDIYVMNEDGSQPIQLTDTSNEDDQYPAWSPTGDQLAFARRGIFESALLQNMTIWVIAADGSNLRQLTTQSSQPAWSPDGSQLAIAASGDNLAVVNVETGQGRQLTPNEGYHPDWSPDGSQLAFDDQTDLYLINSDGNGLFQVTSSVGDEIQPVWSPDGAKLAFVANGDRNNEIYVIDLNTRQATRLTNNGADDTEPAWSPDGSQIAFASNRSGNWEIYVMNADGSDVANISNHPANDRMPAWAP